MTGLRILQIAPGATIQDRGRPGWQRFGVTGGGALDDYALAEGQALLANEIDAAALEFQGRGGEFEALTQMICSTSGGSLAVSVNGEKRPWREVFVLDIGDKLEIGGSTGGAVGYLHVKGGFDTQVDLDSRSTHLRAGLGTVPVAGEILPCARSSGARVGLALPVPYYFNARLIRAVWGPQSSVFTKQIQEDFVAATFTISPRRDRMGIRLTPSCGPITAITGLTAVSDAVVEGDIQIAGDGVPAVLLADHQPTGGYPRIATVITADLPAIVQMPVGAVFKLRMVSLEEAVVALRSYRQMQSELSGKVAPRVRDPRDMTDLLTYSLVGGVIRGDENEPD